MDKQWYVIHAYSGYEMKVREALLERIERMGRDDLFGEIMVPSEEVVEMKGGQERKTQRKFFPGYVLVNMELNDDSWHLVMILQELLVSSEAPRISHLLYQMLKRRALCSN
jgi:transcriptional antiterminator NusG